MSAGQQASGNGQSAFASFAGWSDRRALDFVATPRFEIIRRIGLGGMGSVYEAIDCKLDTRVALKRLDRCEPHQLIRFKREFREFQDLRHQNLVTLRELFSDGAEWFFSMELLDGVDFLEHVRPSVEANAIEVPVADVTVTSEITLNERWPSPPRKAAVTRGPLDEERLRNALPQLALGIQALHDAAKLHCDVKPSNVLVTRDGRVVLLDYGVAVDLHDLPRGRRVTGTVAYMAPEQAACRPTGRAADWYAVGVMLYEALTGRRPFEGTAQQILAAKQHVDAPSPRELAPESARDLVALCEDLLAVHPGARPRGSDVLARLGVGRTTSRRRSQPTAFIGRTAQLLALDAAYQHARDCAQLVFVCGEAGVGKNTLMRQFVARVERNDPHAVVLSGTCYERESVPYKALDGVIDALSCYLMSLPSDEAQRLLPERIALLANVFPVLWGSSAVRAAASNDILCVLNPSETRERLCGVLRDVLRRMSEAAPLVVVIEDVQWADADSLALLSELVREPHAPRLLLVATLRTDAANDG